MDVRDVTKPKKKIRHHYFKLKTIQLEKNAVGKEGLKEKKIPKSFYCHGMISV